MSTTDKLPNVARAGAIMFASIFLSRVLGIVRDTVMSATIGIGRQTDAYTIAFRIPDILFFLIAGGALSSAFIPVFSEYLHTDREEEAWKIFSVVTTVMSLIIIGFIIAAWIFAGPLTYLIAPSAKVNDIRPEIIYMSRIVLPAQYAFFIGGLMFGTLYSRQKFVAPGLGPNVYNLGIIFGALILSQFCTPPISGMSWGALVGAFIGNLLIPLFVMKKIGFRFKASLDIHHPGVKKVFTLMLPVILGLSLPAVYGLIMQAFGSYYPKGINTALDLSNKLMQAPLGIFGQSLALAIFPALTQFFALKKMDMFRNQFSSTLRTIIYITIPVTILMFVYAPEIVTMLFAWGKTSGRNAKPSIDAVAVCLRMFSIGITAWCLHPVLMRGFYALQKTVLPIVLGTSATALFVALAFGLTETSLGYAALPLASSISAIVLVFLLAWFVAPKMGGFDIRGLLVTFIKACLAGLVMALVLWVGQRFTPGIESFFVDRLGEGREQLGHNLTAATKVFGVGLIGAWGYYFATRLLKMPETAYIDRAIARLDRRK